MSLYRSRPVYASPFFKQPLSFLPFFLSSSCPVFACGDRANGRCSSRTKLKFRQDVPVYLASAQKFFQVLRNEEERCSSSSVTLGGSGRRRRRRVIYHNFHWQRSLYLLPHGSKTLVGRRVETRLFVPSTPSLVPSLPSRRFFFLFFFSFFFTNIGRFVASRSSPGSVRKIRMRDARARYASRLPSRRIPRGTLPLAHPPGAFTARQSQPFPPLFTPSARSPPLPLPRPPLFLTIANTTATTLVLSPSFAPPAPLPYPPSPLRGSLSTSDEALIAGSQSGTSIVASKARFHASNNRLAAASSSFSPSSFAARP